jgi:voltage-gated potassium channel
MRLKNYIKPRGESALMGSLAQRKEVERVTFKRVLIALVLLVLIIIVGSIIKFQEANTYKEALYKTVSIVTHIDLGTDSQGFISFILYVIGGILSLFIVITLIQFVTEGTLKKDIEEDRNMKKSKTLTNHIIICGAGRVGSSVAEALDAQKQEFIVLDQNPAVTLSATKKGWLAIEDDALDPRALELAGVEKARAVVTCLDSDGDNVLLCLTVKEINPRVSIIARADHERNIEKLKKAGASEVIMPTQIGGQMIAKTIMAPNVKAPAIMSTEKK